MGDPTSYVPGSLSGNSANGNSNDPAIRKLPAVYIEGDDMTIEVGKSYHRDRPKPAAFPAGTCPDINVMEILENWGLTSDFSVAKAVEILSGLSHSDDKLRDMRLARWYLDWAITRRERAINVAE